MSRIFRGSSPLNANGLIIRQIGLQKLYIHLYRIGSNIVSLIYTVQ